MSVTGEMAYLTIGDDTYSIPSGGGSSVGLVEIGVSTYSEVLSAYNTYDHIVAFLDDDGIFYYDLVSYDDYENVFTFSKAGSFTDANNDPLVYAQNYTINSSDEWDWLSSESHDYLLQTNPVTNDTTRYPVIGSNNTSSAETRQIDTTGFKYIGTNGTKNGSNGQAKITLGNSTASTSANWKAGKLELYGTTAYATTIVSGAPTTARTITLPNNTGTVALTSDIPDVSGKIDTAGTGLSKSSTTLNHTNSVTAQTTQAVYPIKIDAQGHISAYGSAVTIPDVSGKIDTAGTGLSKSGTTLNHTNSITAQTTQAVYPIKIDAQGHISAYGSAVTIPDVSGKIDTAGTGLSKSGTTLNHTNSITAQTTSAVYPLKIDAQGHITEYGSAVSIPSKTSDLNNDSGFVAEDSNGNVSVSGTITVGGHTTAIGYYNSGSSTHNNFPNNSQSALSDTITVSAGTWILVGRASYPSNTTGRRILVWHNNTTSTDVYSSLVSQTPVTGGFATNMQSIAVVNVSASTIYELQGLQTSGSTQNVPYNWVIVRIA